MMVPFAPRTVKKETDARPKKRGTRSYEGIESSGQEYWPNRPARNAVFSLAPNAGRTLPAPLGWH
ncbi:hypothetical protein DS739_01560 [Acetobacter sp. JWB]|nr:hypothetical protein CPF11_05880 [Acetobacter pomorum]AXC25605.1 hypothetical protein DS739_01560 [Acetobacter sp. JWB]